MITLAVYGQTEHCSATKGVFHLNKQLLIFMGIGLAVAGAILGGLLFTTKGSHLELTGKVLKVRTGALDENNSVAVLDFRIENPSNVLFVVRTVKISVEKANGEKVEGRLTSKPDLDQLFQYNRFLGSRYNDAFSIKDKVPAHGQIDRMAAATFEMPQAELEKGKSMILWVQDMDGAEFETTHKLQP